MTIVLNILITFCGLLFSVGLSNLVFEFVHGKTHSMYLRRMDNSKYKSVKIIYEKNMLKLESYQMYNNISTSILWLSISFKYIW